MRSAGDLRPGRWILLEQEGLAVSGQTTAASAGPASATPWLVRAR